MPGIVHHSQPGFQDATKPRHPQLQISLSTTARLIGPFDANTYMDWSSPSLQAWLSADLDAARSATWRFVAFH